MSTRIARNDLRRTVEHVGERDGVADERGGRREGCLCVTSRVVSATGSVRESDRESEAQKLPASSGENRIVPLNPQSGEQTRATQVFVDQEFHSGAGPSRPRVRSWAASWSRSCSISGRFWAT